MHFDGGVRGKSFPPSFIMTVLPRAPEAPPADWEKLLCTTPLRRFSDCIHRQAPPAKVFFPSQRPHSPLAGSGETKCLRGCHSSRALHISVDAKRRAERAPATWRSTPGIATLNFRVLSEMKNPSRRNCFLREAPEARTVLPVRPDCSAGCRIHRGT